MSENNYQKELNEFTYIVSHDLNAPFRHVREFTKLLLNRIDDRVHDEEREYFEYIQNSVEKAESMLDALLIYSRLNTLAKDFKEEDLPGIVEQVLRTFEIEIQQNNITVLTHDLPSKITCDKEQIKLLFECLVNNAIQYRKAQAEQTKITISAQEDPNNSQNWLFTIQDNGRGIDDKFLDQIFTIFKTAHFDDDIKSTGAGLTIAKKIVWRHGGKIWIESKAQQGTTVFFTLSKAPQNELQGE